MINAVISGTGSYLPSKKITNLDLEKTLDTTDEWIKARTGIKSRRIISETDNTSTMALAAAQDALASANMSAESIDLILVATCTPSSYFPTAACYVQGNLGSTRPIPALDIGAACSGFIYALDVAKQYIATGSAKNVLVIGSESMSTGLDWSDRSTCILFGDGAAAVVLSASDNEGVLGSVIHARHDADGLLTYPTFLEQSSRPYIAMRGHEVFKQAVTIMGDLVDEVLQVSNLQKGDITWLIPHQANIRIIKAIAKKLNMSIEQVVVTLEDQGNTSAASIPLALDYSVKSNKIKRGDVLLLESFGAGMTWGAMVVRY